MKKALQLIPILVLVGCAQTTTVGRLTVDSVTGVFDPSVSLATAKDEKGNVTMQQIVSGPGAGQIIYNGAAQVGAAAVFGIGAASNYKPATSRSNTTVNNGNSNSAKSASFSKAGGGAATGGSASSSAKGLGGDATANGFGGNSSAKGFGVGMGGSAKQSQGQSQGQLQGQGQKSINTNENTNEIPSETNDDHWDDHGKGGKGGKDD